MEADFDASIVSKKKAKIPGHQVAREFLVNVLEEARAVAFSRKGSLYCGWYLLEA